jgi:hypothetical protein
LFVEPSPFSHISGMKNRFECLIKTLREAGDEVMVVTPDVNPPKEFCGAQVRALQQPVDVPTSTLMAGLSHFTLACAAGTPQQAGRCNMLGALHPPVALRSTMLFAAAALSLFRMFSALLASSIAVSGYGSQGMQRTWWYLCSTNHIPPTLLTLAPCWLYVQVVNVLGFKLPFYKSATLLLSLGLSIRVLYYLFRQRPHVIHVSTPGIMCFAAGDSTGHAAPSGI